MSRLRSAPLATGGISAMTRWPAFLVLLLFLAVASSGCGSRIDLAESVRLVDVTTGWFDAGITDDGLNKLVPSISLRIRNEGSVALGSTQLNLLFKRQGEEDPHTESYVRGIGTEGLEPGATTPPIVVRAQQGYTGIQPRMTMLQNTQFVDFRVEVFGRHGSATWVKIGEFPIQRQLLTQ
jgi:hypothetical protein